MKLQDILGAKDSTVYRIDAGATLEDVAETLVKHNVGSLLVFRQDDAGKDQLAGIITERDFLHVCAAGKFPLSGVKVIEVMTTRLITGSPDDTVEAAMGLMTKNRIRHLPVLSEGQLLGLVSIGDLVKVQHDGLALENRFMKDYIRG